MKLWYSLLVIFFSFIFLFHITSSKIIVFDKFLTSKGDIKMANRFVLNETSYHGKGAIQAIVTEAKARGFKKALVCSDPDLVKFNVTQKVTSLLDEAGLAYELFTEIVY